MFVQPPEGPVADLIKVEVDGRTVRVPVGSSAAHAAMLARPHGTRRAPATGEPRAPYCLMGVCFECLLEIDGQASRQGCLVAAREGMIIRCPDGAREL
jgi:hypothetical protein